ncbi:unnamed protein product [Darwinula stevensoni]|uniref:imidazolonepropionase n=1 Tax=Darwinula stevensoni TaxID=69355 RepID=A0A7R9AI76_9CRUS|nr:unnamed protein product [Darwinula stevensoni]CAG0906161.1 unnamed protein product [Darwinula stevensoni]
MTMYMACVQFGMSMQQAMVASTLNAAASLGRSATHGSLEPGKVGDILLIDSPRFTRFFQVGALDLSVWKPPRDDRAGDQERNHRSQATMNCGLHRSRSRRILTGNVPCLRGGGGGVRRGVTVRRDSFLLV